MSGTDSEARDTRSRHDPPWGGQRFGAPATRVSPPVQQPAARPRALAPFEARFAWRPEATDFPVALIEPPAREAQPTASELPWYVAKSEHGRHLPKRALPPLFAIVVVAGALVTRAFWTDRTPRAPQTIPPVIIASTPDSPDSAPTGASTSTPTSPPTATPAESLLGQPGQDSQPPGAATASPAATATADTRNGGVNVERASGNESLLDIAARAGLRVTTLVWANDTSVSDPATAIPVETPLVIPPVDGVVHRVVAGDTLESIAERYGVTVGAITGLAPNGVQSDGDLREGLLLTVPGGTLTSRAKADSHAVRAGETLAQIADWYGLDEFTLAFANDVPSPDLISVGQQLVIPPAAGLYVQAAAGDTVESLAERYGVDPALIRGFGPNDLAGEQQPAEDQSVLLPGAGFPREIAEQNVTGTASESAQPPAGATVIDPFAPEPASGFAWPAHGYIAQPFSAQHPSVDIANLTGAEITAADAGAVTFAGWNDYGLGYAVAIDHGNGLVTWYGHLSAQPSVAVGQQVKKGQYLGPMGSTGKTTTPILSFMVMQDGAYVDPLSLLP